MKFIFGMIGLILGALMGEVIGALIGLAAGVGFGVLLARLNEKAAVSVDAPRPARGPLEGRVAQLELELASLRAEVRRLGQQLSGVGPAQASPEAEARLAPDDVEAAVPVLAAHAPAVAGSPWPAAVAAPVSAAVAAVSNVPVEEPVLPAMPGPAEPEPVSEALPVPLVEAPVPGPASAAHSEAVPPPVPGGRIAPSSRPAVRSGSLQDLLPPVVRNWIFGGNTIVKAGVLILFLGLAFLLRYAADRVTVPVEMRYAGVALAGAFLLGLGWRLRDRRDAGGGTGYGLILQGAGIGVFYLTILAALKLNGLLPPELAFAFLFMVAVLSAVLAVVQNASWLAFVAAAEGFAAPVLVSTGSGNHIALFSYLAILDIGIFIVAWHRAWRPLNLIGCIGTFMLAGGWAQKYYSDALFPGTQAFLLLFFCLFTAIGVLFARRALAVGDEPDERDPLAKRAAAALGRVGRVDSTLVFGVPLASFSLQYLMVRDFAHGPALAAFAFSVFYLLLGGLLVRGGNPRYSLLGEAYVVVSVLFGTLTIPLALEGTWTGATWAIEAAGIYWLGLRQQRVYARAFAGLVFTVAVLGVLRALGLDLRPGTPLLTGSVLSMVLLGASAFVMFGLNQRAARRGAHDAAAGALPQGPSSLWEVSAGVGFLWSGLAALCALVWLVWVPQWACAVTSLMAFGCALCHRRSPLRAWLMASAALHLVALAGFAGTLHGVPGVPMLSNGWQGLVTAMLIGVSLLATGWLPLQAVMRAAQARGTQPVWSLGSSIGLLAGVAMLAGSLLFVMPADQAARVWPWMGVAALWLGLRLDHPALGLAWAWLQLAAGAAFLVFGPDIWQRGSTGPTLWTPLLLTLAALLSGDWLQRASKRAATFWNFPQPALQWVVVLWALFWWVQVLLPEALRWLRLTDALLAWAMVLTAWVLSTSLGAALLARWRDWPTLGRLTAATVPAWALTAWLAAYGEGNAPHAYFGWLVWPLAAAWHLALLRRQERWCPTGLLKPLHVLGFWLFVLLAAREVELRALAGGDAGSTWVELGRVIVPVLVLGLVTRPALFARWPLADFRSTYMLVACAPLVVVLVGWLWRSSTGSGAASPLPYVPLLNPLEIGHGLVLLACFIWYRTAPTAGAVQAWIPRQALLGGLWATLFLLYTGVVLRTCHHWAGVPWEAAALFASTLTQSALSAAWSLLGVALMLVGHRRARRLVWVIGAALLAVVVVKLFFVELADRGGLYRIVSFIVVGVLLLTVGYFAPVPPASDADARPE